jgi:hypothetical protein
MTSKPPHEDSTWEEVFPEILAVREEEEDFLVGLISTVAAAANWAVVEVAVDSCCCCWPSWGSRGLLITTGGHPVGLQVTLAPS